MTSRIRVYLGMLLATALLFSPVLPRLSPPASAATLPSTKVYEAGLHEMARYIGKYVFSADGFSNKPVIGQTTVSGTLQVEKPAGATTVENAFLTLVSSSTNPPSPQATLDSQSVTFTHRSGGVNGDSWRNWLSDVTNIVSTELDSASAGTINVPVVFGPISRTSNDNVYTGVALTVIFNSTTAETGTTIFQFGHASTSGETTTIDFSPLTTTPAGALLSLGIGWSIQSSATAPSDNSECDGTGELTCVDITTTSAGKTRVSNFAGGRDDSLDTNPALITVGGVGDTAMTDSSFGDGTFGSYTDDSELYDISSLLDVGDDQLVLETFNPSGNDTVFQLVLSIPGVLATQTISFDANGGSGSMPSQTESTATALTSNGFNRTGYLFGGWNTDPAGTGTAYTEGATYAFTSDDTLYAQWLKESPSIAATHDRWFEGDGSDPDTGRSPTLNVKMGTASTTSSFKRVALMRFDFDPSYVWTSAALDLVVASNTKGNVDPGYGTTFTSFNVKVYGANDADWSESGTNTSAATSTNSDWKISLTHPYSMPGGTYLGNISVPAVAYSGTSPTIGQTYSLSNAALVSFLNNDSDGKVTFFITRSDESDQSNLEFASSENTSYDGPTLSVPGASFSFPVAYDINGGSGSVPAQGSYIVGSPYTVAAPANVTPPTGESFAGWNSSSDGSGTSYPVGSSYATASSLTLYAQYTANPVVTFNSNDGSSQSNYQAVSSGVSTALSSNSFSRTGYTFSGWNTATNGSGTSYADGANISTSASVTLYAQWSFNSSGSGGSGSSGRSTGGSEETPVTTPTRPTVRLPFPPAVPPRPTVLNVPVTNSALTGPVDRLISRVGGVPSPVTSDAQGDDEVLVSTSSLRLSLKLNQPGSVSQDDESTPELIVRPGARAALSGSGLLPDTSVQVWLPNVTDRELGRLSVNANGEITGEVSLSSAQDDDPLPIGRQTLQVTGYDEDGNQTVVEMPVNIAQGPPAPEPNREVDSLPDLGPGQSLATSAGIPTTVAVTPFAEQRLVNVDGGNWRVSVAVNDPRGEVSGDEFTALIRMTQSGLGAVNGDGFLPGTVASLWFFSEPTLMGTVTVAEDGSFDIEFLVDAQFIPVGEHTLQVQGVGTDGYIKAANLGVLIDEPPAPTTATEASVMLWWVFAAAIALALIIVLVVASRRRRAS